jgi:hypothetical protein
MHLVDTGLGPSFCSNERFDLFSHSLDVPGMGSQMIQGLRQDLKDDITCPSVLSNTS